MDKDPGQPNLVPILVMRKNRGPLGEGGHPLWITPAQQNYGQLEVCLWPRYFV